MALVVALVLTVPPIDAQTRTGSPPQGFLQIQQIPGMSRAPARAGWIELVRVSFGGSLQPQPDARNVSITKRVDKATPLLADAYKRGVRFSTVRLAVPAGDDGSASLELTLHNASISAHKATSVLEHVSFTFDKISITTKPMVQKPDREGPLQSPLPPAFKAAGPGGPADLLPVDGLTIADTPIAWGETATISSTSASSMEGGRCRFRYRYVVANQGQGAAGATASRIRLDAPQGPILADDALPGLAAGAQHTVSGTMLLAVGTWTLYVHADADAQVAERNEQNNLRRVRVQVEGSCHQ